MTKGGHPDLGPHCLQRHIWSQYLGLIRYFITNAMLLADDSLKYLSYFSQKIGFDISNIKAYFLW